MELSKINKRIESEYSLKAIDAISDKNLMTEYKSTNSLKKQIEKLTKVLEKHIVADEVKNNIIDDYLLELIPPGTKGVIRGLKFNAIVKEYILALKLPYEIEFEKSCAETNEKPDWYIKHDKKIMIGMNQLDLWNGGAQINRGSKYVLEYKNNENVKLVCVVCNKKKILNTKTKIYQIFNTGFSKNTLCYLNGLETIIKNYFQPELDCKLE